MRLTKKSSVKTGRPTIHPFRHWADTLLKSKDRSVELVLTRGEDFACQPLSLVNQVYVWSKRHDVPLSARACNDEVYVSLRE